MSDHRLFVAVPLPHNLKQQLGEWIESKRVEWDFQKWIYPEDIHITLQFLGDTTSGQMEKVIAALKDISSEQLSFSLNLQGIGAFGKAAKPTILWAGVGAETDQLYSLQKRVTTSLEPIGFSPDSRPYHPHITLARKYKQDHFAADFGEEWRSVNKEWTVDRIVLYESKLGNKPMYHEVVEFPFNK